jgi:hypothetical protein
MSYETASSVDFKTLSDASAVVDYVQENLERRGFLEKDGRALRQYLSQECSQSFVEGVLAEAAMRSLSREDFFHILRMQS